ncbi:putative mediator of RNA polymerase II transcription subunit 26 isoform X2 [Trichomycterus rosablanca]|uniref:putative mediator of RNA polymerase II transcription subunit 26 isoform X2 n=1 Tax=Trichomycterus rosablanca TaxID=2290929 RepID=UPI002F354D20
MFWFKKLWCCSVPADEDEEPHRPKPEKKEKKKKKWWQRLKKKARQEDTNVEEQQIIGNEENAGMSTQVLQDQGQEPEVQVVQMEEKNQVEPGMEENQMMGNENAGMSTQVLQEQGQEPEVQVVQMEEKNQVEPGMEENQMMGNENAGMSTQVLQDQGQEPEVQVVQMEEKNQVEPSMEANQMMGNEENAGMSTQVLQDQGQDTEVQVVQMEEKNQVKPSMEEKNLDKKNQEEQKIEDPLEAVLEKIFRSSDEVVQQQNVQDEHILIAPTFITQYEEYERLMETTIENEGMFDPAGAPVSPLSMLKLKRTSRWTERPVMVLPSSQYVSSALLCSAALWRPSERPRSTGIVQKLFRRQNKNKVH